METQIVILLLNILIYYGLAAVTFIEVVYFSGNCDLNVKFCRLFFLSVIYGS